MRIALSIFACVSFASCGTLTPTPPTGPGPAGAFRNEALLQISPECLAAKLTPPASMPASMVPDEVLRKAQSGSVSVRYDVVAGAARNAKVVASNPTGLYDAYVLRHVNAYTEPSRTTVGGCVMTTEIKF